jgi:hypothetical protein
MKRSDLSKREFSPTGIESYMRCPRLFYYSKALKLIPISQSLDQHFGISFHAGVATYYKIFQNPDLFDEAKLQALKSFGETWKTKQVAGNEKKSLQIGLDVLSKYCDTYRRSQEFFKPELVEMEQTLLMPNETYLVMILDRIFLAGKDYVRVDDTKTTGQALSDWYFKGWENSFQLMSYAHTVKQIVGHYDSIQVDSIHVPMGKAENFVRRTFQLTSIQEADFLNTYIKETNSILEALKENSPESFPCRQKSCSDFGGCKYLNICKYGFDYPDVKTTFIKEEIE